MAQRFSGYEVRPGQARMSEAVEEKLSSGGVLLVEAGTGTGKTLAYLVPAVLSGRKIVVSTATRALQDQIYAHDLPVLRECLGLEPRVALMKGLGNYLCRRRYEEFVRGEEAYAPRYRRAVSLLGEWVQETETGDLSEVGELGEDDPIWGEVAASSDTRIGATCPHFEQCFVTRMKRAGDAADVVVINHHLFFADLALRGPHPGRVIPDYDAVIFDEAHQLEEVATHFFGVRVSRAGCERLVRDAGRLLGSAGPLERPPAPQARVVEQLAQASQDLWASLATHTAGDDPRIPWERDQWSGELRDRYFALDGALETLGAVAARWDGGSRGEPPARPGLGEAVEQLARRSAVLREELASVVDGARGRVTWLEVDGKKAVLGASPVELADLFCQRVFSRIPCVVLTSATLSGGPAQLVGCDGEGTVREVATEFGYLRSRLGLEANERTESLGLSELVVPSPFDYPRNALFYTPTDLPSPADPGFRRRALGRVAELVAIAEGGAFVLTTSLRSMRELGRGLAELDPRRRVLVQGRAPKQALLEEFRRAGDAVLVATMSFWEGVDVPGSALRLVVLEKIPFAVPTDPVVRARALALEARGRDPFMELIVPSAGITLKQGFGRLIRTQRDRGVVALLDGRVLRRGYGKRLLRGLPPAARTSDLAQVREFFSARRAVGVSP